MCKEATGMLKGEAREEQVCRGNVWEEHLNGDRQEAGVDCFLEEGTSKLKPKG